MASDLQRSKVAGVFEAMDVDHDGFLDRSDFEALTARWIALRGGAAGSPDHTRLTEIMMGWWHALLTGTGAEQDRVALDDVLHLVEQLHLDPAPVVGTASAMFEAVDENGDGEISAEEYNQLIEAWTGRPTGTDEIFQLLDLDGDGHVSREEFVEHWTEFWVGDDRNAPGTWVFGTFDLTELQDH